MSPIEMCLVEHKFQGQEEAMVIRCISVLTTLFSDTGEDNKSMLLLTLKFKWSHIADFEDYFVLMCFALFRFFLLLKVTPKTVRR